MGWEDDVVVTPASGWQSDAVVSPSQKKKGFGETMVADQSLPSPMKHITDAAMALASGAVAGPASGLAGIAGAMLPGPMGQGADWVQKVQDTLGYDPQTGTGKAVMAIPAAIGGMLAKGGEKAGSAIAEKGSPALGAMVNAAIQAAPAALPGALRVPARAAGSALQGEGMFGAKAMMQRALKPSAEARKTGKADQAIQTLLDEGVNVSPGGRDKLTARIDPLDEELTNLLRESGGTVDRNAVASRLDETRNRFENQFDPQADIAAVEGTQQRFLNHPKLPEMKAAVPEQIVESPILNERGQPFTTTIPEVPASGSARFPVQLAQQLKRGTYSALGDKAYGEVGGASEAAQKAGARGLAEEIVNEVPEAGPINAEMGPLINARNMVADRVSRSGNKDPIGLGALHPSSLALWLLQRSELGKSLMAHGLNKAGNMLPGLSGPTGSIAGIESMSEAQRKRLLAELLGSQ